MRRYISRCSRRTTTLLLPTKNVCDTLHDTAQDNSGEVEGIHEEAKCGTRDARPGKVHRHNYETSHYINEKKHKNIVNNVYINMSYVE